MSETKTPVVRLGNLVREGDSEVVAVYCLDCGRAYSPGDGWAGLCCHRPCAECGVDIEKSGYVCCEPCRAKREADRRAALVAKAVRVPAADYDGPVYCEGTGNDGFSASLDDLLDSWDEDAPPAEVWACTTRPIRLPPADQIVDDACEDTYEDAAAGMPDTTELQQAIDAYNARITAEVWEPDFTRLLVIPAVEVRRVSAVQADPTLIGEPANTPSAPPSEESPR